MTASAGASPWASRDTRPVCVGGVRIGGAAPVSIQTMTKTDTCDVPATVAQIERSAAAGADLVRVAVPSLRAIEPFAEIARQSPLPVIAVLHLDYRIAVERARAGAAKLRSNPGNIGDDERLSAVIEAATEADIPIRVGVNSGSLEADLLERYGGVTAAELADSALRTIERMHRLGFEDLVVSIKATDVPMTVRANRALAARTDLPLHLGITEAGFGCAAAVKSAAGLGILHAEGIGETVRETMTDPPEDEVAVATRALRERDAPLHVAVMGCEVNGPGEARQAHVGLAAGRGRAVIFARGEQLRTVPIEHAVEELMIDARRIAEEISG